MPAVTYPAPIEQVMTPLDQAMLRERRHRLVRQAKGRVLELGGAGGINLQHYAAADVDEVTVVGSDGVAQSRLRRTASNLALPIEIDTHGARPGSREGGGEGAGAGGYDTIVAIFTLSARPDLEAELTRLLGLLAPTGRLLFLDHSPRRRPGITTELSRPLWRLAADGFVPGRDLPVAMRRAGYTVVDLERFGLTTLTLPLRSCVAGVARCQIEGGFGRRRQWPR